MDQTQLQTLDPKLREAYERVMGTAAAQRPGATTPQAAPVQADQPAPAAPSPAPAATNSSSPWATTPHAVPAAQNVPPPPPAQPAMPAAAPPPPPPMADPQMAANPIMPQVSEIHPAETAAPPPPPPPPVEPLRAATPQRPATLSSLDTTDATQMHAYVSDEVAGVKQSLKLIQLVYIIGGIIFFAVYALFWVNFFNIALPF